MKKSKKHRLERLASRTKERREGRIQDKIKGILSVAAAGYGFVRPGAGDEAKGDAGSNAKNNVPDEVFIPAQFINGALDGDEVVVGVLPPRREDVALGKGPAGKVLEILNHGRTHLVGELLAGHKVRPLSRRISGDIEVSGGFAGAKRGDWVKVKLRRGEAGERGELQGSVVKPLGRAGTVQGDLDAVAAEFDLPPAYTPEEDAAAMALEPREIPREDHRELETLTIDPDDAKDFDDALSLATLPDGKLEVGVHIADVAAWIEPGSKFDKQAAKRSFTAYLPGRTLPMLPKSLTAKISMQAHQDSPAHSVFFILDPETYEVLRVRRAHTMVHVDLRLDYDEVQTFIDRGEAPAGWSESARKVLHVLTRIAQRWRKRRYEDEKFLDLELPEIRVRCDEESDTVTGLERKVQRESEELVEEFMLAANVAVANELIERGVPGLFRVHAEPDPLKLEEFSNLSEESFGVPTGDLTNRVNACRFLEKLPDGPRRAVLVSAFLRSLPRAAYSETPSLHYGLGKTRYSHFTSPIRRYPDLTVHQQLWNFDANQRWRTKQTMAKLALSTSEREANNDDAYYSATDRLKLRYLSERLTADPSANFYEGVVAKVMANGLLVDVSELGIYGFVPLENLAGSFRRTGRSLDLERGHKRYKAGDFIYLTLSHIDFARGSAVFYSR